MLIGNLKNDKPEEPMDGEFYVFATTEDGRHSRVPTGKIGYERHGAFWGQGSGVQGRAYAIALYRGLPDSMARPDNGELELLPFFKVKSQVDLFTAFARNNYPVAATSTKPAAGSTFYVADMTAELSPYEAGLLVRLFAASPSNVRLPAAWKFYLRNGRWSKTTVPQFTLNNGHTPSGAAC